MQLTVDGLILQEAIRVVAKLAPPVSGSVTIQVANSKAYMHSVAELSRVSILMPGTVDGEATFAIDLNTLKDASKNRGEITCKYEKTLFKIKSGSYLAELATSDALNVEEDDDRKVGTIIKLSSEQSTWLKSAVTTVALKPITILSSFMPVTVKLSDKGAFVSCYDTEHMAFLNSKEITGDMDVTLPADMLQAVLDTFSKAPLKMQMGVSNLHVSNALIKVSVALPQAEDNSSVSADDVINKAKSAIKEAGLDIEVSKKDILDFLDNSKAIATKERGELTIQTEKGKLKLEVVTSNGTTKTVLKANVLTSVKVKVDFEFFNEAISKCPESVNFRIVGDSFICFKAASSFILVSLNQ